MLHMGVLIPGKMKFLSFHLLVSNKNKCLYVCSFLWSLGTMNAYGATTVNSINFFLLIQLFIECYCIAGTGLRAGKIK